MELKLKNPALMESDSTLLIVLNGIETNVEMQNQLQAIRLLIVLNGIETG